MPDLRHLTTEIQPTDAISFSANGNIYIRSGDHKWSAIALCDLGVDGTVVDFTVDTFSPGYIDAPGDEINGWLGTSCGIFQLNDLFGTLTVVKLT